MANKVIQHCFGNAAPSSKVLYQRQCTGYLDTQTAATAKLKKKKPFQTCLTAFRAQYCH